MLDNYEDSCTFLYGLQEAGKVFLVAAEEHLLKDAVHQYGSAVGVRLAPGGQHCPHRHRVLVK